MTNPVRSLIKRSLRRIGHALPIESYLNKYVFGYHVAGLFKRLRVDCVLDVGAHHGGYGEFLRNEVGYTGQIISFEPCRNSLEILRAKAKRDGKWAVLPFALGDADGALDLNVMRVGVFNSFLEPKQDTVGEFKERNHVVAREPVQVRTLDSLLPELRHNFALDRSFLKVDTQGFDMRVLKGGCGNLQHFLGVQVEASVQPLYVEAVPFTEVLQYLLESGFELSGAFPVVRDERFRLVEFDLLTVRRNPL